MSIRYWAQGATAPMTPVGFLSLFRFYDLVFGGALLLAVVTLVATLVAPEPTPSPGSWLLRPVGEFRLPRFRFRVQAILALVALVAVEMGWEITSWRNWRQQKRLYERATHFTRAEAWVRDGLDAHEAQLARLNSDDGTELNRVLTPEANAAERAYLRDFLTRNTAFDRVELDQLAALKKKYLDLARDPAQPLTPDAPRPDRPLTPDQLVAAEKFLAALACYDDLLSKYPNLARAYVGKAALLATCSDPAIRNGKEALAAAIRGCELCSWRDPNALQTLAAAYAEVGDFAMAIEQQQKAQDLVASLGRSVPDWGKDRMAVYKAGRPYHVSR
jgi:hypothetical protein